MLSTTDNPEGISDAANQMSGIIRSQIKNSFGTNGYGQALEAVGVLRAELIAYEEPELYNDFIKKIRDDILENQLGGDRRELWWEIRKHALGLVDHQQSEASSVSEDEAKAVSRSASLAGLY
jgi:ATP-dependent DNA helicase 2 subunit 2